MANEKVIELSPELITRIKARKELRHLFEANDWSIIQILFQEVQAECEILEVLQEKKTTVKEQVELLRQRIEKEFEDDAELKQALLDAIPTYSTVTRWVKNEAWKKSVQNLIRQNHVFSNTNQLRVLENLLKTATAAGGGGGSVKAIELYFRLEGSLGKEQNSQEKDATYERYKNLQKTLHKK